MKIRRYIGKDAQEAMLKVKMDLGSEAVILNTRKIRQRGFLSFMSKPMIEVLAAIDEYQNVNKKTSYDSSGKNGESYEELRSKSKEKEEKIALLENKVNSMENILQKIYQEVQQPVKEIDKEPKAQKVSKVVELLADAYEADVHNSKLTHCFMEKCVMDPRSGPG